MSGTELAPFLLGALVGLVAGAAAAWLVAARTRDDFARARVAEAAAAGVSALAAANSTIEALRDQLRDATERANGLEKTLRDTQSDLHGRVADANARLDAERENLAAQRKLLDEAEQKLANAFAAVSGKALAENNEKFLHLAKERFETLKAEADGELGKRQEAIGALVKPLGETLAKYEEQVRALEAKREKAYGAVEQGLKGLGEAQDALLRETTLLSGALRNPTARGRWGEMTLQRVAELAGMVENCDFATQETVQGDEGRQRPDMIVRLPGGRSIAVDAKVPLDAYLEALVGGTTPEAAEAAMGRHARALRAHLQKLAGKAYWKALEPAPEFVIMFVPGEPFLAAALQQDPRLIEDGAADRVLVTTPSTMIAALLAVAHGWRQQQVAENARTVETLGKELYDRMLKFGEALAATGDALGRSVEAYNKAVGSYEGRLAVTARRFRDLGVGSEDPPEVERVDTTPRAVETREAA